MDSPSLLPCAREPLILAGWLPGALPLQFGCPWPWTGCAARPPAASWTGRNQAAAGRQWQGPLPLPLPSHKRVPGNRQVPRDGPANRHSEGSLVRGRQSLQAHLLDAASAADTAVRLMEQDPARRPRHRYSAQRRPSLLNCHFRVRHHRRWPRCGWLRCRLESAPLTSDACGMAARWTNRRSSPATQRQPRNGQAGCRPIGRRLSEGSRLAAEPCRQARSKLRWGCSRSHNRFSRR